jgi:translocation and assembly module TamA
LYKKQSGNAGKARVLGTDSELINRFFRSSPRKAAFSGNFTAAALRAVLVVAGTSGVMAPQPAAALELFGFCLIGSCKQADDSDGLIDPKPYNVTIDVLADGASNKDLEKAVKNASVLWLERKKPAAGSAGLLTRAKADYKRILASLYNDARYGGDISIRWGGREIADIAAGTELPDNVNIAITVRAEPQFRFGTAAIENEVPPATLRSDRVALPADEGFFPGELANATTVKKAGRLAVEAWRQQSYAKAEITDQTISADHDARLLNARLRVTPGRPAVYGPVDVTGTQRMYAPFVARQTGLVEGREYDPDDLKRAEERLQRLGVFRSVALNEADEIDADGSLPFALSVQERKLHRIGVGTTVSTVDGAGVEAFWLHRNLFGRAERLRFDARIAGIGTTVDFKQFDYFLGTTLTLPGRFTPDTDVTVNVFADREVLDLYSKNRVAGSAYAENFFSEQLTLRGGIFTSYGEYDDVFGVRRFGIAGIEGGVKYDSRDNKLSPKSGVYADLKAKPFYEWENSNFIGKIEAEGRAFLGLGPEERTVLAARLKVGSIAGASIMDIPQDELFLAGGGTSVRGYPFRSIGVAVPGGVSGGRSLFEASGEVRQQITDNIGMVGFADVGIVGDGSIPDFSGRIRVGAGAGLRYNTGLGPIRLDVAVPLNRQPGDPAFAVYAGIGQAF